MAEHENSFAMGLVCQSRLSQRPDLLQLTPGVNMASKGDSLGQQYVTPTNAVLERGADVIIVGRGITRAENVAETAAKYKEAGWMAYLERVAN